MSGFMVAPQDAHAGRAEVGRRDSDAVAAFAKKGLVQTYSARHGSSLVRLFANASHDPIRSMSRDGKGRFCTYVGTMLYKGRTGNQATKAILDDLEAGRRDFVDAAFGNFCVLLGDQQSLRILTDPAGLHHVYHSDDLSIVTNSFVAAACQAASQRLGHQEILEYILLAATFGRQSLVRDVKLLPARGEILVDGKGRRLFLRDDPWVSSSPSADKACVGDQIDQAVAECDRYFAQIASAFGGKVTAALSGGYDSRLVLGMLLRHGVSPRLFVYGSQNDPDVRTAKLICKGEGLELLHLDRGEGLDIGPHAYWRNQDEVFHGLDGLTQYGFACEPYEVSHRRERVDGGLLAVNGGGGEIWRDFWKLPDRSMTPPQFLRAVYGGRLAGIYGSGPRSRSFLEELAGKVAETTGNGVTEGMTAAVIQSLYSRFRIRFWQGKNNSVDNHIGYAVTPFSENAFAVPAMWIPVSVKRDGWFERQLIRRVAPQLATYDSAYGYDFVHGPGLTKRMAIEGKCRTPLWLRRLHRRYSGASRRLRYHAPEFVRYRFGAGRLEVERYVRLEQIRDPLAFSRALAVERMLRGQWIVN